MTNHFKQLMEELATQGIYIRNCNFERLTSWRLEDSYKVILEIGVDQTYLKKHANSFSKGSLAYLVNKYSSIEGTVLSTVTNLVGSPGEEWNVKSANVSVRAKTKIIVELTLLGTVPNQSNQVINKNNSFSTAQEERKRQADWNFSVREPEEDVEPIPISTEDSGESVNEALLDTVASNLLAGVYSKPVVYADVKSKDSEEQKGIQARNRELEELLLEEKE